MKDISENEVYGKIVELRSKDVDNDKNSMMVIGMIKNVPKKVIVTLNSEQIKQAAISFKNNKTIKINAILEKEKAQYRVKELYNIIF
ncbi:MAG: hypothetical protein LBC49_03965 [Bacteroidales bacterium]|jgi:hypothetical protein|nr:hypothetical protein [Bacteroidales bacterium]